MNLLIPLCCLAISSALASSQYVSPSWELDRARSAWDFGGHHSKQGLKKLAMSRIVPGNITAERRIGKNVAPVRSPQTPFFRPNNVINVTSAKQRSKPKKPVPQANSQIKNAIVTPLKSSNVHRRNPLQEKIISSFLTKNAPQGLKRRVIRKPKQYGMHRNRIPRKISSRSDSIRNNFRKEDLWHLDKGEHYQLKTEDLHQDFHKRYPHGEHQNHEHEEKHKEDDENHKMEMEAEKMVKDAGNLYEHKQHHKHEHDDTPCDKDHAPVHIHHHHHHDKKEKDKHTDHKKHEKKLGPRKLTPAPLPRIHNPIPLGCLITIPVFHPIRPRHHLGCFLSIPGTPNLMKKRRRRSAEFQYPQLSAKQNSNANQGFVSGPPATRKYYNNHVGPGPQSYAQAPLTNLAKSNFKIPATIITPPKFDKSDILQMLTGTGVGPTDVGKILMTNNRYVRIGRGLPNSGKKSRSLWGPESVDSPSPQYEPQYQPAQAPPAIPVKHQSNITPNSLASNGAMKPPRTMQQNPFVALTPFMQSPTHQLMPHPISPQSNPVVVIPVDQLKNLILAQQNYEKGQFNPSPSAPASHTPSKLATENFQAPQKSKFKTTEKFTKSYKKPTTKDILKFESVDAAESQISTMKVKPPSDKSVDSDLYAKDVIDVSDLAEAISYQLTDEDLETLLETTTEEIPDEVEEEPVLPMEENVNKENEKVKSFSYAVKNIPSSPAESDYTYADESKYKYSVVADDYNGNFDEDETPDEYVVTAPKLKSSNIDKYKYKFPKTKKGIPDPIYVKVPKDSIVY